MRNVSLLLKDGGARVTVSSAAGVEADCLNVLLVIQESTTISAAMATGSCMLMSSCRDKLPPCAGENLC